jgi:hypothetical protein
VPAQAAIPADMTMTAPIAIDRFPLIELGIPSRI